MSNTIFIDFVKLVEIPDDTNHFYVVESANGKHYVSALGGREAKGLPIGTQLKLFRTAVTSMMTAYQLERA